MQNASTSSNAISPKGQAGLTKATDEFIRFLFWSWNLIFLAFMLLGFSPRILPELISGVQAGLIPAAYLLYGTILALIPVAAVLIGLTVLRGQPTRLFALGYVVEGPLMLLLALRFFILRQANPGVNALLTIAIIGMSAFLWYIFDKGHDHRRTIVQWLLFSGLTVMLLCALYAAIWISFYAAPITAYAFTWLVNTLKDIVGFFHNLWLSLRDMLAAGLVWIPFTILGFILTLYTIALFVMTPIAVTGLVLQAWLDSLQTLRRRVVWFLPILWSGLIGALVIVLFILANRQPQALAFELLKDPPESRADRQALVEQQEVIRGGLLNAYLSPFRYISAHGEVSHINEMYQNSFKLSEDNANSVQRAYEAIASPLLYDPVSKQQPGDSIAQTALTIEPQQAARLYRRYFDEPIVEGERQRIVQAVRSTWAADQAEAAWQAVDDREVLLLQQELTILEHGDWANVELFETYQNQTGQNQEVIYYFNLPESAVITGLWLGNTPNREDRFTFQVAPRGAAQAVYREQTRVQRDPALVEQIGPRQYRLRIFPIPPITFNWNPEGTRTTQEEAKPLYMWMTYAVMAKDGTWPMPHLAVGRNVYWGTQTTRLVNGSPLTILQDAWLPPSIPGQQLISAQPHRVDLLGGQTLLAVPQSLSSLPSLAEGLEFAVVLDRSRSMQTLAGEVQSALARLAETNANVEVYLTASSYFGEAPSILPAAQVQPLNLEYFGGQNAADLLLQFQKLRQERVYDAIFVLTDGNGYELGTSPGQINVPDAPLWMVHLGDDLPLGYDDLTLQAIQASGGGVVGDLEDALQRLAAGLLGKDVVYTEILDGYTWRIMPTSQVEQLELPASQKESEVSFMPFAVRFLILTEMRAAGGQLSQVETLDWLHTQAVETGIVTPYSSMIVLVDAQQQSLLNQLSQLDDRFQREVEDVGETSPGSQVPLTGVPEPEEWLLILLAAGLLAWTFLKQTWKKAYLPRPIK